MDDPPLGLNESTEFETLTEGKVLNAIRWKLAKFSLRFLKESAIDEFLKAYYTDKDGKLAPKGKEWLAKSKKEKIKKMKDLADNLKEEEKQKIVNSEAAKRCEKQAVKSGVFAALSVGTAAISQHATERVADTKNSLDNVNSNDVDLDATQRHDHRTSYYKTYHASGNNDSGLSSYTSNQAATGNGTLNIKNTYEENPIEFKYGQEMSGATKSASSVSTDVTGNIGSDTMSKISGAASVLAILASIIFSSMWASLIMAGFQTGKSIASAHKANVLRREEIMKELLSSNRNLEEDFEFASIGVLLNEFYY